MGLLWVVATNPAVSMPDLERTKAALLKSPFTICQDAYYPTETSNYAHLLLPALQWGEKTGAMTNSERVVTYCPQFRDRPGEAWADWEIFAEVGRRLGFQQQFRAVSSAEVYAEFVQLTGDRPCDMTGLSHQRLATEGPIQWPCPANETKCDPETTADNRGLLQKLFHQDEPLKGKRLYTDRRFHTPDGRARFAAYHSRGLAEPPNTDYPFVLTIGRLYGHWHTMTRTGRIKKIQKMHPNPFLEIHPRDADRLSITDGEMVEVRSPRGMARFPALITKKYYPWHRFCADALGRFVGRRYRSQCPEPCRSLSRFIAAGIKSLCRECAKNHRPCSPGKSDSRACIAAALGRSETWVMISLLNVIGVGMAVDYDLVVIGATGAGIATAKRAIASGKKVALVQQTGEPLQDQQVLALEKNLATPGRTAPTNRYCRLG